jgi:hypothetical protein
MGAGEAGIQPPTIERWTVFLAAVEGSREGQTCVTPLDRRPYDVRFVGTVPRRMEGEAHPGPSIHYWTFYGEGTPLKLPFPVWERYV